MASTSYSLPKYQNDNMEIQRLIQNITQNIQKIAQNVNQIENMNMQIGTLKDSESLRDRLLQTENNTNQLAKETNKQLKELNIYCRNLSSTNPTSDDRQFKIQKERLTNDLVKTLNNFQEVQKLAMKKQKESNERARSNLSFNASNDIHLKNLNSNNANFAIDDTQISSFDKQQQQQQAQLAMESDVNLTQLREREEALKRLEHDIVDVNMIFKDLAVMVHDQGEIIDSIENNVEQVQVRVVDANTQLEEAKKYQTKARKKKFILACILAGVLLVIIAIIVLSLQPWRN